MQVNRLPTEVLQMIFGHCSGRDQKTVVAKVCHRWAGAVQSPIMLQRTCLIVSRRPDYHILTSRTVLIAKTILLKTNRQYTCLNIEWRHSETNRNMETLSVLLDICEERFALQRLYLRAPPSVSLVRFFVNRQEWLKNLVELHVKLEPPSDTSATEVYEMSFPHLKELTWYEFKAFNFRIDWYDTWSDVKFSHCYAFGLNAPELCQLTVGMRTGPDRDKLRSRLRDVDACCLFLPTLELRTYTNLESVTIKGLDRISQRSVDNSKRFLQKMRKITFIECSHEVIEQICEKCSNLKELTIAEPMEGEMDLQISPVLSPTLEHLNISSEEYFQLYGEAEFLKLQSIRLDNVYLEEDVTLTAPQLTTFDTSSIKHNNLTIAHVEQIRTFKVRVGSSVMETVPPPPNVTELYARCSFSRRREDTSGLLQSYMMYFPKVRRLTLSGSHLDLSFVDHLQHLEYFSARYTNIRLTDVKKLAFLKTLILSSCTLKSESIDDVVSLTALNYVRIYQVSVAGIVGDHFPILVNCNQPPIELVKVSYNGVRVFSSGSVYKPLEM